MIWCGEDRQHCYAIGICQSTGVGMSHAAAGAAITSQLLRYLAACYMTLS